MLRPDTVEQLAAADVLPSSPPGAGWRVWAEIAVAFGLILATIWSPRPEQQWLYLSATAWVVLTTWIAFPGWNTLGFRRAGLLQSSWVVGASLAILVAALCVAACLHTLRGPIAARGLVMTFGGYAVFSLVQQFLMQSYFLLRFRQVLRNQRHAVSATVGIFALAHLPNPILTPLTALWGLCACLVFIRWRNLLPLGVAHAMLGIGVALTVPGPVIHNMRVGLGYVQYRPNRLPPPLLTARRASSPDETTTGSAPETENHPH